MAASAAIDGFGAIAAYESAPSTFTSIGELVSVSPPNKARDAIDTTHMASDDGYEEFIASSVKKGGESTLTFNYTEAGATLLETIFDTGIETFKITTSGGSTWTFTAVVTAIETSEIVIGDKMGMSMTLKITGKPVYLTV